MSEEGGQGYEFGSFRNVVDCLYDGLYIVDRQRQIVYWNKGAERITGYSWQEVQGRRCSDNILNHVDAQGNCLCRGNCPTAETLRDGESRESELFLHHKEGHRLPVALRTTPLFDDHGVLVGAVEVFSDNTRQTEVLKENQHLARLALIDDLTQIANRRYGEERINEIISEAVRYSWPFGVLFVDIDHFKALNDQYGHEVGDKVLKMVAATLKNGLRSFDVTCRWGGEEFVCAVKHVDREQLEIVGEKLRTLVDLSSLKIDGRIVSVTVSVGGALARNDDTVETLVARADKAMYECKNSGRDRVIVL